MIIETDISQSTLETLTRPLSEELQQLQQDLAVFDARVNQVLCGLESTSCGGEQGAIRMALALEQLRSELTTLICVTARPSLPQLATQASARLRFLSTHFRGVARQEQINAQVRRAEELCANAYARSRLSGSSR